MERCGATARLPPTLLTTAVLLPRRRLLARRPGRYTSPGISRSKGRRAARLQIEVASATSFDKLAVTGNMVLSGELDLRLTGGYTPHGRKSYDILDWNGALSGQFDVIILRPLGGMFTLDTSALYTTGVVTVIGPAPAYTADFDDNGRVDGGDLLQWRGDVGVNALSNADSDGDSDGADFLAWQRQLGSGAPGVAAADAVPEPCAVALIAMLGCGLGSSVGGDGRQFEGDATRRRRRTSGPSLESRRSGAPTPSGSPREFFPRLPSD